RAGAFSARAESVGATVWQVAQPDVPALVDRLLVEAGVRLVALDSGVRGAFPQLTEQLTDAGLELMPPDVEPRRLAQADAGVSLGACPGAQPGPVAIAPPPRPGRPVSVLPPL